MSLGDFQKAHTGNFVKAADLKDHMKAKLASAGHIDTDSGLKDKDGNTKTVFRQPVEIKNGALDGVFLWTPGNNAIDILVKALGPDQNSWRYPVVGHFETQNFAGRYAKVFIPDSTTVPKGEKQTVGAFRCLTCFMESGRVVTFDTAEELAAHTSTSHPMTNAQVPGVKKK